MAEKIRPLYPLNSPAPTALPVKPVIYQLVVRYFSNTNLTNQFNGDLQTNGCGKFVDISDDALTKLRAMGITHLWLTGVLRQATLTDYSPYGMPADDPNVVKGLAGSFFAIRDYFDVCPDYATTPPKRLEEFVALIDRIHTAGLQALIDLVPNHVSRAYRAVNPADDIGGGEDVAQFQSPQNNFYYLVDPPHQSLRLEKPAEWNPPGVVFNGRFAPEDGSPGHPPKVTGNNVASPTPSATDWYETIKLNYGFDFHTGSGSYTPRPRTWDSIDHVLAYWQGKGVDGFRCDFAHYVPTEAWSFLISRAKARRPAYFFAESYPSAGSRDPVQNQEAMTAAGFDAVYHYQLYNALKGIYTRGDIDVYNGELLGVSEAMRPRLLGYLENHDESRVAAPIGVGGFGSVQAGRQLLPLQMLCGNGPVMILNGQEVGEPGADAEGFSGDHGRTTFFDYWTMPEFAKWVNGHAYDGGGLTEDQRALRAFYSAVLNLCQHRAVTAGGFWSLWYFNRPETFGDCPFGCFTFARYEAGSGEALLVAANFRNGDGFHGTLRIPPELVAAIQLPERVVVELVLDGSGAQKTQVAALSRAELTTRGFPAAMANQSSQVFLLHG